MPNLLVPADIRTTVLTRATELGALTPGDFTLSSGQKSKYYFDGRLLTLDARGLGILGQVLIDFVYQLGAHAVGGPTLGADPIVGAVLAYADVMCPSRDLKGFLVRGEAKGHGTQKQVEGHLRPGMRVIIVDDTCSTGGSVLRAIAAAEAAGCTVVLVFVVLDRNQGGSDELRRRGYQFVALLEADAQGSIKPAG